MKHGSHLLPAAREEEQANAREARLQAYASRHGAMQDVQGRQVK